MNPFKEDSTKTSRQAESYHDDSTLSSVFKEHAMFDENFPSNPIPFIDRLKELVLRHGTDSIRCRNDVKALLFILMAQSYGQCATINLEDEYSRLKYFRDLGVQWDTDWKKYIFQS